MNKRPSPALVIACLALALALGGTSYAAAVALAPNSVGTTALKANAVISSKVKNGSLLKVDFKAGQLPAGPAGAPGPVGPAGAAGAAGAAGPAGPTNVGATLAAKFTSSTDATSTSSTGYTDLASTTLEVPAGSTATLVANFSAESACYGASTYCGVRINVDGNEMTPNAGSDFAFDGSDAGNEGSASWESHAITRYQTGVAAGNHTITIQYRSNSGGATFRLDDWALSVVAYKQ